ncbi:hypothetical protein [Luteimonas panaciterrae]|uniref:hypothetical protein n=1 Tax=Luteimonas panaciterrae TaxID=363885 RepID=UPI001CF9348B|nr:hypothetical protein [Luteimonas panaciterrae]
MKREFSSTTLQWGGLFAGLILGFLASPASAFYVEDEKEYEALLKRSDPSADDLKEVLGTVGAEAEDDRIRLLLAEANGKDVSEQADDDGESQDAPTW